MTYLCRNCGNKINFEYGKETVYCTGCKKEIARLDTISDYVFHARMTQLKAMHELMRNANDEEIYMSWICLMPDEPREEDFKDIALDDESYNECFDLFIKLIKDENNRW
jgi:hypothetical protein